MLELLLTTNGVILGLISLLALLIYWQLFDLIQHLYLGKRPTPAQCAQYVLRTHQLFVWCSALPLLGLIGTVGGLLDSFSGLMRGDSSLLTTGIAEALLTTQLGLTTALPALLLLMLCRGRCQQQQQEAICIDTQ